jgi:hypothetical protein
MHKTNKIFAISSLLISSFITVTAHADVTALRSDPAPHFSVIVENKTDQNITMRFRENQGSVYLQPALADKTPLAAHQNSMPYGVVFPHLGTEDTFDMTLTGKQDCTFTIGFYASGNPRINIQGPGCFGGGYSVNLPERTVSLYITDIHKNQ